MLYFITEQKDRCVNNIASVSIDNCVASMEYNYYGSHYPEVQYTCTCGTDVQKKMHSENGKTFQVMGTLTSRFLDEEWYNTIDIDPVLYQCKKGSTLYNYNTNSVSCYYRENRLYIYRQFYEIFKWKGKEDGVPLIDNFRKNCYIKDDCTPMKFDKYAYWDSDRDSADPTPTPDKKFAFCRKVINEDVGFMTRFDDFYEFGIDYTKLTPWSLPSAPTDFWNNGYTIKAVGNTIMDCQYDQSEDNAANSDALNFIGDFNIFYDLNLQSCVSKDSENDTPISNVNRFLNDATADNTNESFKMQVNSAFLTWDNNVAKMIENEYKLSKARGDTEPTIKYDKSVFFAFPTLNTCYELFCSETKHANDAVNNEGDFTCLGAATSAKYSGYIRYEKNHKGEIAWKCVSNNLIQEMNNENTFFLGNGLKQMNNHCVNLDPIYEYKLYLQDYWIHTDLENEKCMLLYGKKPENAVAGEESTSIWDTTTPITYEYYQQTQATGYFGYLELYGTQTTSGGFQTFAGETYTPAQQICSNSNVALFKHTWELHGTASGIWDWTSMKCYITTGTDAGYNNYKSLSIYDIEPHPLEQGKYRCTVDIDPTDPLNTSDAKPLIRDYFYGTAYGAISSPSVTVALADQVPNSNDNKYLITQGENYFNGGNNEYPAGETMRTSYRVIGTHRRNTCQYPDTDLLGTPWLNANELASTLFYDIEYNFCGQRYDISQKRKVPIFEEEKRAFIDLGSGTCYYHGSISGELIEFEYNRERCYDLNLSTVDARETQELTQDFDDSVATIKCRFYDISVTPAVFQIQEFTLDEVVIAGLRHYLLKPEAKYTRNVDLYLIEPQFTSVNDVPYFRCILVSDNERLYDPMAPFPTSEVPAASALGWKTYTLIDHKCGSTPLNDKYYKIVFRNTFPYQVIADTWGDRCYFTDGTVWILRYDEYGLANACLNPEERSQRTYISFRFKDYNMQKFSTSLKPAFRLPTLPQIFWNSADDIATDPASVRRLDPMGWAANREMTFEKSISTTEQRLSCRASADPIWYRLQPEIAMCYDDQTVNAWVNVCKEIYYEDEIADIVVDFFQFMDNYEGIIDLCKNQCYMKYDSNDDGVRDSSTFAFSTSNAIKEVWNLIALNEFAVTCQNNDKTKSITRYNEEFKFFGNRGSWFALTPDNQFKIKRIELELAIPYAAGVWGLPKCIVDDDDSGWYLNYRREIGGANENRLCFDEDWWCQKDFATTNTRVKLFYSDPDNHFSVRHIFNSEANHAPFLAPGMYDNTHPLRQRVLVDVFNGKCYYGETPTDGDDQYTPLDIVLTQNVKEIFASIDNFTQEQVDNMYFRCGTKVFLLQEIYFMGFRNEINVENCPKGTYKDPETGNCLHCMFECDVCLSADRCEDCKDSPDITTINYKPCGPRCFKGDDTDRNAYADAATGLYWEVPVNPYDGKCKYCRDLCTDCDGYDACTTCEPGAYLYTYAITGDNNQNVDITICISYEACEYKTGWFADNTQTPPACMECDQACDDCTIQGDNCTLCSGNNYLTLQTGETALYTCATTCNVGYIDTAEHRCNLCHESCDTCNQGPDGRDCEDGQDTDSNECGTGYIRVPNDTSTPFICTNLCQYGQHVDDTTKTCIDCHESCSDCNQAGPKYCTWCAFNRIYNELKVEDPTYEGECISVCPLGMFEYKKYIEDFNVVIDTSPQFMSKWVVWQPLDTCHYEYVNNVINMDDVPRFCEPCHETCATCFGPSDQHCSTCADDLFMRYNAANEPIGCFSDCPDGQFPSTADNTCQPCSADACAKCEETPTAGIDTCLKCQDTFYLDRQTSPTSCKSDCGSGFFENDITQECALCDSSVVTNCEFYARRGTSCTSVLSKPKLNMLTRLCVAACPPGTTDNTFNVCEINSDATCNEGMNCSECYLPDKCKTCAAGYKRLTDTHQCVLECPERYRISPWDSTQCEPCGQYEKSCGPAGATECLDDVIGTNYVLKGWPISYCVVDTTANDCDLGWYEKDLTCHQCSEYCTDGCTGGRYQCNNDCDRTLPAVTTFNPIEFCFDKRETGRLCLCDLGFTWEMSEDLLSMEIKFEDLVGIDWEYFESKKASILATSTEVKDRSKRGDLMEAEYDTPRLKNTVSESTLNDFIDLFKYVAHFTQTEIDESNLVFQEANQITSTMLQKWTNPLDKDEWGFEEYGVDLIKLLFQEQNWSVFGDYSFTTSHDGVDKKIINVKLGADHMFNPYTNPLVLRERILRREGCNYPYEYVKLNEREITDLPDPKIKVTTDYGGEIDYPAVIPYCVQPTIIVEHKNFPKNVPQFIEWELYNDLREHDCEPDLKLLREVNELLKNLPPQTTRWTVPRELVTRLTGYTLFLRIKATPFFTGKIAISTVDVNLKAYGDSQLKFTNQFTEYRFKRMNNVWTPEMKLDVPPCVLGDQNERSFINGLTFNVLIYTSQQCGVENQLQSSFTFTFNKGRMAFKIDKQTFTHLQKHCARIQIPASEGLMETVYDFELIPEQEFPLIVPKKGTFMEVAYGTEVKIPFKQYFDSDQTIINTFSCLTKCGDTCDYMDGNFIQQRPVIEFTDISADDTEKTLTISAGGLLQQTIYVFTIYAGYNGDRGSRRVYVRVLKEGLPALSGYWSTQGINSQGYALGGKSVVLTVLFDGVEKFASTDKFDWIYEQRRNSDVQWNRVPLFDSASKALENFQIKENVIKIKKVEAEREHRIILDCVINGVTARYVYELSTLSGINIDFSITPLLGDTSILYSFNINVLTNVDAQLQYTWEYEVGDKRGIIGQTVESNYQNYINQEGNKDDEYYLGVNLYVKNLQRGTQRVYTNRLQNKFKQVSLDVLDQSLTLEQRTNALIGVSTNEKLVLNQVVNVINQVADQFEFIDKTTAEGYAQTYALTNAQVTVLRSNLAFADDIGVEVIDVITNSLVNLDATVDDALVSATLSETTQVQGIRIIDESIFRETVATVDTLIGVYKSSNAQSAAALSRKELVNKRLKLKKYENILVTKLAPSLIGGQTFTHSTVHSTLHITKLAQPYPDTLSFQSSTSANSNASPAATNNNAGGRRLQDDSMNTDDLAEQEEEVENRNYNCQIDYLLGSSTLSGHPNLIIKVSIEKRDDLSEYYIPVDTTEELAEGVEATGIPMCDPAEFTLQTSTPGDDSITNVSLVYLNAETDQEKYSICFTIDTVDPEVELDVQIRRYDEASQSWVIEGESDVDNTDAEIGKYCQKVSMLGLYALYEVVEKNETRLYSGFILYIMFGIDLFLIVGVILGAKLDQKQPRQSGNRAPVIVDDGDKQLSGVQDDDLQKQVVGDEKEGTQKNLTGISSAANRASRPVKFGESFKLYHRCINICASNWHFLKRPGRVFSLALQVAILTNLVGLLTFALDFGNTAAEAVVGYVICFIVLRISNFVFYKSLFHSQRFKGCCRIATIIILVLVYLACHVSAVFVTLYMEDSDFTAWTIAFFVCIVVDLVVWELIVTAWQMMQIRNLQRGRKACCDWQVSIALKNYYVGEQEYK